MTAARPAPARPATCPLCNRSVGMRENRTLYIHTGVGGRCPASDRSTTAARMLAAQWRQEKDDRAGDFSLAALYEARREIRGPETALLERQLVAAIILRGSIRTATHGYHVDGGELTRYRLASPSQMRMLRSWGARAGR